MKILGALKSMRAPSIFDLAVIAFILILPMFKYVEQAKLFFIFGIVCLMFIGRNRRVYNSLPLSLLALWGVANVFIHSYGNQGDFASKWISWCMLNEGFIYLFFGILLIFTCL